MAVSQGLESAMAEIYKKLLGSVCGLTERVFFFFLLLTEVVRIAAGAGIFDRGDNYVAGAGVVLPTAIVGDLDLAAAESLPGGGEGDDFIRVLDRLFS